MIRTKLVVTNLVYCILTKQKVQGAWRFVFLIKILLWRVTS